MYEQSSRANYPRSSKSKAKENGLKGTWMIFIQNVANVSCYLLSFCESYIYLHTEMCKLQPTTSFNCNN